MKEDTVYQHGTLAMLIPGLFDGTLPVSRLLEHGDSGIGTCAGLDGEMVVLGGHAYTIRRDGTVEELAGDVTVPFATVHFDAPKFSLPLKGQDFVQVKQTLLAAKPLENVFFAVKITGTFAKMKTRTVFKQEKPYPGLNAVADQQAVFEGKNTQGTVIGYFAPELFQGVASSGFHLHYLSDDHQLGGHILDLTVGEATAYLQPFADFQLHLPLENPDFMQQRFDLASLGDQISKAEH